MMGDRLKMIDTHIYDGDGSKRIERGKPRSRCQPSRDDICEDPVMPTPVIIVTGVSRAIAEELQSRGATVVGATRNVADVPTTASLLPVAADVTQEARTEGPPGGGPGAARPPRRPGEQRGNGFPPRLGGQGAGGLPPRAGGQPAGRVRPLLHGPPSTEGFARQSRERLLGTLAEVYEVKRED